MFPRDIDKSKYVPGCIKFLSDLCADAVWQHVYKKKVTSFSHPSSHLTFFFPRSHTSLTRTTSILPSCSSQSFSPPRSFSHSSFSPPSSRSYYIILPPSSAHTPVWPLLSSPPSSLSLFIIFLTSLRPCYSFHLLFLFLVLSSTLLWTDMFSPSAALLSPPMGLSKSVTE